jgi:hypothetical protein
MVCARAREQLRVLLFQDRANSPGQFRLRNCGELRSFWFEMLSITETEHARCDKLLCDAEASRECSSEGSGPAGGVRADRKSQRPLRRWLHLEGTLFQLGASRPVPNRIDYLAGRRVRRPFA